MDYNIRTEGSIPVVDDADRMRWFKGRGVQYYLGFHKGSTTCKGHVRLTDCHYLSALYGSKIMGAYYLGCPMTGAMKDALYHIFRPEADEFIRKSQVVRKVWFRYIDIL